MTVSRKWKLKVEIMLIFFITYYSFIRNILLKIVFILGNISFDTIKAKKRIRLLSVDSFLMVEMRGKDLTLFLTFHHFSSFPVNVDIPAPYQFYIK
ncbi:MAG TPA: hypothetical protein DHM90_03935 [Clostridiaceae bacterium]|nr:hypothetical protein [Clostridiaceae bacterium]